MQSSAFQSGFGRGGSAHGQSAVRTRTVQEGGDPLRDGGVAESSMHLCTPSKLHSKQSGH